MHIPTFIKYLVIAWGVPIANVFIVPAFTPDPRKDRSEFPQQTFKPARVWMAEKQGSRNTDYFELRIQNPTGEEFFHRDPEPGPIHDLHGKMPKDTEIRVLFSPGLEGNVLMEITSATPSSASVLSFESVMNEYASRHRFIFIIAAIWCVLANLLALALWMAKVPDSKG